MWHVMMRGGKVTEQKVTFDLAWLQRKSHVSTHGHVIDLTHHHVVEGTPNIDLKWQSFSKSKVHLGPFRRWTKGHGHEMVRTLDYHLEPNIFFEYVPIPRPHPSAATYVRPCPPIAWHVPIHAHPCHSNCTHVFKNCNIINNITNNIAPMPTQKPMGMGGHGHGYGPLLSSNDRTKGDGLLNLCGVGSSRIMWSENRPCEGTVAYFISRKTGATLPHYTKYDIWCLIIFSVVTTVPCSAVIFNSLIISVRRYARRCARVLLLTFLL